MDIYIQICNDLIDPRYKDYQLVKDFNNTRDDKIKELVLQIADKNISKENYRYIITYFPIDEQLGNFQQQLKQILNVLYNMEQKKVQQLAYILINNRDLVINFHNLTELSKIDKKQIQQVDVLQQNDQEQQIQQYIQLVNPLKQKKQLDKGKFFMQKYIKVTNDYSLIYNRKDLQFPLKDSQIVRILRLIPKHMQQEFILVLDYVSFQQKDIIIEQQQNRFQFYYDIIMNQLQNTVEKTIKEDKKYYFDMNQELAIIKQTQNVFQKEWILQQLVGGGIQRLQSENLKEFPEIYNDFNAQTMSLYNYQNIQANPDQKTEQVQGTYSLIDVLYNDGESMRPIDQQNILRKIFFDQQQLNKQQQNSYINLINRIQKQNLLYNDKYDKQQIFQYNRKRRQTEILKKQVIKIKVKKNNNKQINCFHKKLLNDYDQNDFQGKQLYKINNIFQQVKNKEELLKMFFKLDTELNKFICTFCGEVLDIDIPDLDMEQQIQLQEKQEDMYSYKDDITDQIIQLSTIFDLIDDQEEYVLFNLQFDELIDRYLVSIQNYQQQNNNFVQFQQQIKKITDIFLNKKTHVYEQEQQVYNIFKNIIVVCIFYGMFKSVDNIMINVIEQQFINIQSQIQKAQQTIIPMLQQYNLNKFNYIDKFNTQASTYIYLCLKYRIWNYDAENSSVTKEIGYFVLIFQMLLFQDDPEELKQIQQRYSQKFEVQYKSEKYQQMIQNVKYKPIKTYKTQKPIQNKVKQHWSLNTQKDKDTKTLIPMTMQQFDRSSIHKLNNPAPYPFQKDYKEKIQTTGRSMYSQIGQTVSLQENTYQFIFQFDIQQLQIQYTSEQQQILYFHKLKQFQGKQQGKSDFKLQIKNISDIQKDQSILPKYQIIYKSTPYDADGLLYCEKLDCTLIQFDDIHAVIQQIFLPRIYVYSLDKWQHGISIRDFLYQISQHFIYFVFQCYDEFKQKNLTQLHQQIIRWIKDFQSIQNNQIFIRKEDQMMYKNDKDVTLKNTMKNNMKNTMKNTNKDTETIDYRQIDLPQIPDQKLFFIQHKMPKLQYNKEYQQINSAVINVINLFKEDRQLQKQVIQKLLQIHYGQYYNSFIQNYDEFYRLYYFPQFNITIEKEKEKIREDVDEDEGFDVYDDSSNIY